MKKFDAHLLSFSDAEEQGNAIEYFFDGPESWCSKEFPELKVHSTTICITEDVDKEITASYSPCVYNDEEEAYIDIEWQDFDISKEDADYLINLAANDML